MIIGASSGGASFFLIIIVGFAILWLLVVRPQKRRQNEQRRMLSDLRLGDEVLTAGGIYGTITRLEEDAATIEIAPQLEVRVARRAIASVTHADSDEEATAEEPVVEEPAGVSGGEGSAEENRG